MELKDKRSILPNVARYQLRYTRVSGFYCTDFHGKVKTYIDPRNAPRFPGPEESAKPASPGIRLRKPSYVPLGYCFSTTSGRVMPSTVKSASITGSTGMARYMLLPWL